MSCPGGACGKDGLEQRMILYGMLAACLTAGVIWVSGYRKTACALASIPVAIAVAGPKLSRGLRRALDRADDLDLVRAQCTDPPKSVRPKPPRRPSSSWSCARTREPAHGSRKGDAEAMKDVAESAGTGGHRP